MVTNTVSLNSKMHIFPKILTAFLLVNFVTLGPTLGNQNTKIIFTNGNVAAVFESFGNADVLTIDGCAQVKTNTKDAAGVTIEFFKRNWNDQFGLIIGLSAETPILPTVVLNYRTENTVREQAPVVGALEVVVGDTPNSVLVYAHYPFVYQFCLESIRNPGVEVDSVQKFTSGIVLRDLEASENVNLSRGSLSSQFDLVGKSKLEIAKLFMNHVYTNVQTGFATHRSYERTFSRLGKEEVFGVCNDMSDLFMVPLSRFAIEARHVYFGFDKDRTHQAVEIKIDASGDWILFDPTFNAVFQDPVSNELMSLKELKAYVDKNDIVPVKYISDPLTHSRTLDTYFVPYADLIKNQFYRKEDFERFLGGETTE